MLMDILSVVKTMQILKEPQTNRLTTETVKGATLTLESVDHIERGDGLALGVLCVCDCVANNTLEEGLENTTGLFVDHWRGSQKMRLLRKAN